MTPMFRVCGVALVCAFAFISLPAEAFAQRSGAAKDSHQSIRSRINSGTVGIISGGIGGTYIRIATDLATVLDDGDKLRIMPVAGKGSVQNITDILYLKGIDIGIVQSDVLTYLKSQGVHASIGNRIHYLTKLYNEEFHLVSSKRIKSVKQLAGRKVNFGVRGSGTYMTASTVFKALGIKVTPVSYDQALALDKIKKGEIAATVYVTGKPARAISGLKGRDGFRLLSVPYSKALRNTYLPASLASDDYPALIPAGANVKTIAVGALMAVFNWKPGSARHSKMKKFVDAFFTNFQKFQQPPRHEKWREVNLAAELPGWIRFPYAAEWLKNNRPATAALETDFRTFVASARQGLGSPPLSSSQRDALFKEFVRWKQSKN